MRYDMETGTLSVQAMLCDYAQVSGGKLFVSGAGVGLVGTSSAAPPHPVNFALALLVHIPWNATNHEHKLEIELISDTQKGPERVEINQLLPPNTPESEKGKIFAVFNAGRAPTMQVGEETLMPVALPMVGLPLPAIGSYFFSIGIDGTALERVSFRVASVMNMPGQPGHTPYQ
jgi:hypothetical protein